MKNKSGWLINLLTQQEVKGFLVYVGLAEHRSKEGSTLFGLAYKKGVIQEPFLFGSLYLPGSNKTLNRSIIKAIVSNTDELPETSVIVKAYMHAMEPVLSHVDALEEKQEWGFDEVALAIQFVAKVKEMGL